MKPIDAFKQALFYVSSICSQRTKNQPGAVIERLSSDVRKALEELKPSDINEVEHIEYHIDTNLYQPLNKKFEKDFLEFDKKILKDGLGSRPKKYDD